MNAFTRSTLAVAERELRKTIGHLEYAREVHRVAVARLDERAMETDGEIHRALMAARWALEEIERAVRLEEGQAA